MPEKKVETIKCDGCNVNPPWEHRCHGEGCNCTGLYCQVAQGKISHAEAARIANDSVKKK